MRAAVLLSLIALMTACDGRPSQTAQSANSAAGAPGPMPVPMLDEGQAPVPTNLPPTAVAALSGGESQSPPTDPRFTVALQLIARGHPDQAEPVAKALVDAHPEDPRSQFVLALALHKQRRYSDAAPLFERAIAGGTALSSTDRARDFPEHPHASHFLAWANYYAGDLDGARDAFTTHIAAHPGAGDSYYGIALIEIDHDRVPEARAALASAFALLPDAERGEDARSRDRGKILARQGDLEIREDRWTEAARLYQRALLAWPDHYEVWAKVARCHDRAGDAEAADRARVEELHARERVGRTTDGRSGGAP